VRSYANIAGMPAASASTPNGSVAFSIADNGFAVRTGGVWTLLPTPTPGSITLAMMENRNTDTLIGRDTAGAGVPEEISVAGGLEFDGVLGLQRSALAGGDVTAPAASAILTLGQVVDGSKAANVAEDNLVGGVPVVHELNIADGITGDIDFVLTHKTRILDCHLIKRANAGGAMDTIQLQTIAGVPITDAMSINVADQAIVRAATIDDGTFEILAGGTLRVRRTKVAAADVACLVVVTGVRVA